MSACTPSRQDARAGYRLGLNEADAVPMLNGKSTPHENRIGREVLTLLAPA